MDEYLNNKPKEILLSLLANPANMGKPYTDDLQRMVNAYPQSGLLQALYARAAGQANPAQASISFNSGLLHKLYYQPDTLAEVSNAQIIITNDEMALPEVIENQEPPQPAENLLTDNQPEDLSGFMNITRPGSDEQQPVAEEPLSADETGNTETAPAPADKENYNHVNEYPHEAATEIAADNEAVEEYTERAPWETDEDEQPAAAVAEQDASATITQDTGPTEAEPVQQDFTERAPWETDEDEQPAAAVTEQDASATITQDTEQTEAEPVQQDFTERAPWETDEDAENSIDAVTTEQQHYVGDEEPQPAAEEDYSTGLAPWETDESLQQPAVYEQPTWDLIADEYANITTEQHPAPTESENQTNIDEEVYDEITGIDDIELVQHPDEVSSAPVADDEALIEQPEVQASAEEEQFFDHIATSDYFVFDGSPTDKRNDDEAADNETPQAEPHSVAANLHQHDVSNYHDEKMPYSFMWWLEKTRQAHGSLYQPYAKTTSTDIEKKPAADELQQQYFENIFHLAPVDKIGEEETSNTIEFDMQSKEDRIIQRFITEDPHIHPPVGERLDTENKAKKSSEDSNDLVTETLARIYADQMLYPKAIATYKKLMLKYPEKSRYFASRIENLEKKTN